MEATAPAIMTASPPPRVWLKYLTVVIYVCVLVTVLWFLFGTPTGTRVLSHSASLTKDIRRYIHHHWFFAPLVFVTIYIVISVLALPIWWLQFLGGVGFGLYFGGSLSLIASTISATVTVLLVRWLAADWFHSRVESRMEKVQKLDEMMGHNGFLVVMTVRLMHVLPFGGCNYALGLSKVSYRDVAIGTLIGNIPATAIYVGIGAGYDFWNNWNFGMAVGAINVVLLLPLILRYVRPQWFEKIGVE